MKKVWYKFDEFFKYTMKAFFEAYDFKAKTEFEVLNLPKKYDVLLVKLENQTAQVEFNTFSSLKIII